MTQIRLKRKLAWFVVLTLTLLLTTSCALFQPRDCETDELPDEIQTVIHESLSVTADA